MPARFHVECDLKVGRYLRTKASPTDKSCLRRTFERIEAGTARMGQVGNEPGLFRIIDSDHLILVSIRAQGSGRTGRAKVLDLIRLRPLP